MIDLKKETEKILGEAAERLAQFVSSSSFEVWNRKDFRMYLDFGHISVGEHDRIFNELLVSTLGMYVLFAEYAVERSHIAFKSLLTDFKNNLVLSFLDQFRKLGVEEKNIKEWSTLINLRFKEYHDDYKVALKESKKAREFEKTEDDLRTRWAIVETITIDCLDHIRRGKVERDDPLWKLLRKWFILRTAEMNPVIKLGQDKNS